MELMLKVVVIIVVALAGLYAILWVVTWAETRRLSERKPRLSSLTNAFLSVQSLIEPGRQYVLDERLRQQDDADDAESGAPPDEKFDESP